MLERLQKLISQAGITSRRAAEELILAGRVTVNGIVVTELGSKADPAHDRICVDGKPVKPVETKMYILLNKPAGFMTTLDDPEGRQVVTDLLPEIKQRVYPVGRLDYNTEGLLLLTNDGDWANRLMHPRHEVAKEYHIRVRGKVSEEQMSRLRRGIELDGRATATAEVRLIKDGEQNDWLSIIIHEGRNRQVRRMCEAVNLTVVRLKRVRYGFLELGPLRPGQYRLLGENEAKTLLQPGQAQRLSTEKTTKRKPEEASAGRERPSSEKTRRAPASKPHVRNSNGKKRL